MLSGWGGEAGGKEQHVRAEVSAAYALSAVPGISPGLCREAQSSERRGGNGICPIPVLHLSHTLLPSSLQASQLGVYRAFVDNYGVAMETAEKCCQANAQFAEISEVMITMTLCRQEHH